MIALRVQDPAARHEEASVFLAALIRFLALRRFLKTVGTNRRTVLRTLT
ncbi:MAG: hypothetical protein QOJ51_4570 [Acidobacteriaceae bacterium]|jgi:hypothetical protein|nr:hypothetical protein [Acidobacteriaceae bacterium]